MTENFITHIRVNQARNVKDLDIPLSKDKRQHLIITGKNGSGKTGLLLELEKFLRQSFSRSYSQVLESYNSSGVDIYERVKFEDFLARFGGTDITFAHKDLFRSKELLFLFFGAKRSSIMEVPKGIEKINFSEKSLLQSSPNLSPNFLQHLVNLKADRSFARDEGEHEKADKIDEWFTNFEIQLQNIFEDNSLRLQFDSKHYNFDILIDGQEDFRFDRLSDGYASIIEIVAELILKSEAMNKKAHELQGIVLVDELETHLHVSLQKKILPFLVGFFPKIQFIVTTHSPFVISSIENAVICDLDSKEVIEDLSSYSYDALIESFFESDKYSEVLKKKMTEYESLSLTKTLSPEDNERLTHLQDYFDSAPKHLSKELRVKLQEISIAKMAL